MQKARWWREIPKTDLIRAISHRNNAIATTNSVERCRGLFDALNAVWIAHYANREKRNLLNEQERQSGRSDSQAFKELLLALPPGSKAAVCRAKGTEKLDKLMPRIMDQSTLRNGNYDPESIDPALARRAQKQHEKFSMDLAKYLGKEVGEDKVLKRLADVAYVVRSNIAHGEKTTRGPDHNKAKRDSIVCEVVAPLLEDILDAIFDHPHRRLICYGSLRAGEANESLLSDLPGSWSSARIIGKLLTDNRLKLFVWDTAGTEISAMLFESDELTDRFSRLDAFEGRRYRRIWLTADTDDGPVIANVYVAAE